VEVRYNSCYAAELSVGRPMPELDDAVLNMALEQIVCFTEKGMVFLDGRQTEFYLVK
ncbi:MAG: Xaa-Pro aminopeptidase, partial [Bacteroidales bacterium]|nr:Xaa-Pro aminopeptidase [Bacteroidales bacterium]